MDSAPDDDETTSSSEEDDRNTAKKESSKKTHFCTFCLKKYFRVDRFQQHLQIHGNLDLICHLCPPGVAFDTIGAKIVHLKDKHPNADATKCKFCEQIFQAKDDYLVHLEKDHSEETAVNKAYMCSDCGKQVKTNCALVQHIKSKCGTLKRFKCTLCAKQYSSQGSLYSHMLRHKGQKNFMCKYCGKAYFTAGQLECHERVHTQEKVFVCKVCGKGFCHRESLITHSSLHTGIKPYQCENCGDSFSCIGNLLKHRKTRADSCALVPLTAHRVKHTPTKIKTQINSPASVLKIKKIQKELKIKEELESLKTELTSKKLEVLNLGGPSVAVDDNVDTERVVESTLNVPVECGQDTIKVADNALEDDLMQVGDCSNFDSSSNETPSSSNQVQAAPPRKRGRPKSNVSRISSNVPLFGNGAPKRKRGRPKSVGVDIEQRQVQQPVNNKALDLICKICGKSYGKQHKRWFDQHVRDHKTATQKNETPPKQNNLVETLVSPQDILISDQQLKQKLSNLSGDLSISWIAQPSDNDLSGGSDPSPLVFQKATAYQAEMDLPRVKLEIDDEAVFDESAVNMKAKDLICKYCSKVYGTKHMRWFEKHVREHESNGAQNGTPFIFQAKPKTPNRHKCTCCIMSFDTRSERLEHQQLEHAEILDEILGNRFSDLDQPSLTESDVPIKLENDPEIVESNARAPRDLICKYCNKGYEIKHKRWFQKHLEEHENGSFSPQINESISKPRNPYRHRCRCCVKTFDTKKERLEHQQLEHAEVPDEILSKKSGYKPEHVANDLFCKYCNKRYEIKHRRWFEKHVEEHENPKVQENEADANISKSKNTYRHRCAACIMTFDTKKERVEHQQIEHADILDQIIAKTFTFKPDTVDKDLFCKYCNKRYEIKHRRWFEKHVEEHENPKEPENESVGNTSKQKNPYRHRCPSCVMTFDTKKDRVEHQQREHSEILDRPLQRRRSELPPWVIPEISLGENDADLLPVKLEPGIEILDEGVAQQLRQEAPKDLICQYCNKGYELKHRRWYQKHVEEHENRPPGFQPSSSSSKPKNPYRHRCPCCIMTFDTKKERVDHQQLEHADILEEILGNGFSQDLIETDSQDVKLEHDAENFDEGVGTFTKCLICKYCDKGYELKHRRWFEKHVEEHENNRNQPSGSQSIENISRPKNPYRHRCPCCVLTFDTKKDRVEHQQLKHSNAGGSLASQAASGSRDQHEVKLENDVEIIDCDNDEVVASRPKAAKNLICKYCDKGYEVKHMRWFQKHVKEHERNSRPSGSQSNASFSKRRSAYRHRCTCCVMTFDTKKERVEHQQLEHADVLDEILANKSVPPDQALQRDNRRSKYEMKSVFQDLPKERKQYACKFCDAFVGSKKQYKFHLRSNHIQESGDGSKIKYKCQECNKQWKSRISLVTHIKLGCGTQKPPRSKDKFSCNICLRGFARSDWYQNHLKSHQNISLTCSLCPPDGTTNMELTFDTIDAKNRHIKDQHPDYQPTKCKFCRKLFESNTDYLVHLETDHKEDNILENGLMCTDCGKLLKTVSSLKAHNKSKCGTLKLFKCKLCDKDYSSQGSLYTHMLRHKGERNYMCRFCAKAYFTSGQLECHERVHTQEKVFICKVCGKGFCHRESLITHSSLHTGVKPYQCENCGDSFSCIGNLLKHRKTRADTCGLVRLTAHRVNHIQTKIKTQINSPASSLKIKKNLKEMEIQRELAIIKTQLTYKKVDQTLTNGTPASDVPAEPENYEEASGEEKKESEEGAENVGESCGEVVNYDSSSNVSQEADTSRATELNQELPVEQT